MKKIALITFIALTIFSCKKEEHVNKSPEIEFHSISKTQVVQFDNSVSITFSYLDRDGDLGHPDPDTYSLKVKDTRLSEADWYHIPPLTPELQALKVEGTFTIELNPLFLLGNGSQETASFSLQLQDRAGNYSNTIATPEVLITDSI